MRRRHHRPLLRHNRRGDSLHRVLMDDKPRRKLADNARQSTVALHARHTGTKFLAVLKTLAVRSQSAG